MRILQTRTQRARVHESGAALVGRLHRNPPRGPLPFEAPYFSYKDALDRRPRSALPWHVGPSSPFGGTPLQRACGEQGAGNADRQPEAQDGAVTALDVD
jgi:hypothetical protein